MLPALSFLHQPFFEEATFPQFSSQLPINFLSLLSLFSSSLLSYLLLTQCTYTHNRSLGPGM